MTYFEQEALTLQELARLALEDQSRSKKRSPPPNRLLSWLRGKPEQLTPASDNSYHAVTIQPQLYCCSSVEKIRDRRYLSSDAPSLPVAGCDVHKCKCKYKHYSDFRTEDRRSPFPNARLLLIDERRSGADIRGN